MCKHNDLEHDTLDIKDLERSTMYIAFHIKNIYRGWMRAPIEDGWLFNY